ncbi:MAG: hypothetical protein RML46_02850 [Anaerolineae bacterium]|nr:hypothetical protein [Anaerolineae bacterium]MDW8067834.1 hypothetical protein [Anaerolineae bacterium]
MIQVYKETFSERQVYRYRITDEEDRLVYLMEPTGLFLPNPTWQITLLGADGLPIGRVEPPDPARGPWGGEYTVALEGWASPLVIREHWELVDLMLLRLPRYLFCWEGAPYMARGSRFGEIFYAIFPYAPASGETLPEGTPAEGVPGDIADLDLARWEAVVEEETRRWGEPVGAIWRPSRGPHYQAEAWTPLLQDASLMLAVLVVLADLHLQEREGE